jgi:hypothetical protein
MNTAIKSSFLAELTRRYGSIKKLQGTQSLYEIGDSAARIYIRYSKIHDRYRTFFGLREDDIRKLQGKPSLICFLWDGQIEPLFIPYGDYEGIFDSTTAAKDGQFKVQVFIQEYGTELYIARAGRFNVESYFGWANLDAIVDSAKLINIPVLNHSQVQTLLGGIGISKGRDIFVPQYDRDKLDWNIGAKFQCRQLPISGFENLKGIIDEVDVIWIKPGTNELCALFEVEHSTSIYSGLLRFNDIRLSSVEMTPKYSIVANETRRSVFVRQLNRPTFIASGLNNLCTFMEYGDVFSWHRRVAQS